MWVRVGASVQFSRSRSVGLVMSVCRVAFLVVFVVGLSVVAADVQQDAEVEKASLMILNAAGEFIDVVRSVKITQVAEQGINGETGRGQKKLMRLAIPLIVGFKIAGIIVAAMTALKVLVFKTLAMSGFAILASVALGAKQLYDKFKSNKAVHHDVPTPYYYPGMAAAADMSWDPSNAAGGYEIHGLSGAASHDLSHLGSDFQASYAASGLSSTGAASALTNSSAYGFVPGTHFIPVAERRNVRQPSYRTTLYKTTVKVAK